MRKAIIVSSLFLTLISGALPLDQAALAAEKSVQLTIPGCTT